MRGKLNSNDGEVTLLLSAALTDPDALTLLVALAQEKLDDFDGPIE